MFHTHSLPYPLHHPMRRMHCHYLHFTEGPRSLPEVSSCTHARPSVPCTPVTPRLPGGPCLWDHRVAAYLTLVPSISSTRDWMSLSVILLMWPFRTYEGENKY